MYGKLLQWPQGRHSRYGKYTVVSLWSFQATVLVLYSNKQELQLAV